MNSEPPFRGYSLPTSSTTYTPNQFFDVVLRHGSRGVVRLVAFMIRKTLGWSDENGQPQEPEVHFSYRQLEQQAGIGHSMIRNAIDDAVNARYIRCIQPGTVNKPGILGNPALYELNWDEREEYITDPDKFAGFFAGNGNLTYIPNDFFDYTIPNETLALVRVVGAVIRYTIGFQTRFGFRRQKIAMSLTDIQKKTGIKGRQHIVKALQEGMERNHIVRLEMGFFDPEAGKESHPAVYGIKWLDHTTSTERGRHHSDTPKKLPENLIEDTPKRLPERTEKVTGEYSEKVTGIEITRNNTLVNNNNSVSITEMSVAVAVNFVSPSAVLDSITGLLKGSGFDESTARRIAINNPQEVIRQQISWLSARNPSRNPLGMLRRAIEENWPAPVVAVAPVSLETAFTDKTEAPIRTFSANFYAGWAGNPGQSAAIPSANDLTAAVPFVQMLLEVTSDPTQAGTWGREFGAYARKMEQDNPKVIRSLVYALRTHSNAFYVSWREKRKQEIAQAHSEARRAHEEQYQAQYRQYLCTRELELEREVPEVYALFRADEVEKRAKYQIGIFANSKLARRILETHDREEERLTRFGEFFQGKTDLPKVLDFWEWDKEMNPERFDVGENV